MTGSGGGPEKTGSVLIVDDDESARRSLGLIFKKKGHAVETARTGQEAVDKAKARFFNVALLDIRLPDIEGVDVLASLKRMHPDMAVIMVTGYASLETAVRALNAGASAYVLKPLDMDHVVATVEEALLRQWLVLENRRLYEQAQRELAERKKVEEALRRSEERYRFLYEESPAIALIIGMDGRVVDANRGTLEAFGYSRDEVVGRLAVDFVVPEDRERVAAAVEKTLRGEELPGIDLDVRTKDGGRATIMSSPSVLVLEEEGKAVGVLVNATDITHRKRAEEELRRSEAHFRSLIENQMEIIIVIDEHGKVTYLSPARQAVLGHKPEEVVGTDSLALIHPDDVPVVTQQFRQLLEDPGMVVTAEVRARHQDGSWRIMEATGHNLLNDPAVRGIVVNYRDITERKRAEQTLAASEEKYRSLTERMSDILWTADLNGVMTYSSPSIARVLGYPAGERSGRNPAENMTPRSYAALKEVLRVELEREGKPGVDPARTLTLKGEYYHKNGSIVVLEHTISAVRDEAGRIVGLQGLGRDITERRRAEEEAARHTRQVEALHSVAQIASRTLDLDQMLDNALLKVVEVMGVEICDIYLFDANQKALLLKAHRGLSAETVAEISKIELDDRDIRRLQQWKDSRAPLRRARPSGSLPSTAESMARERVGSFVSVPMLIRDELQGVLSVGARTTREFTQEDAALLGAIGSEIAVGVENAMLLARMRELSVTDELTGLYNRRRLYEILEVEMSRTQRYGQPFSVVILDLDGFKEYNDRLGHTAGDAILRSVAQTLQSSLRKADTAFRYGGDEFAMMLPGTDARAAKAIVERVRSNWSSASWTQYGGQERPLGFSAGIAQFPDDAETGDGLVFLADAALLRAKREGGHRCTLVSELGEVALGVLDAATQDQVYALAATVDARDPLTYGHSKRVAGIAEMIGKAVGLRRDELAKLHAAALLHDIGKVGIPDSILTKAGLPLDREWKIIRRHSSEGARIVAYVKELSTLVEIIRHHHEWYDGTGYPDRLKGEQIPIGARIISIADAYDTMTTPRPYREVVSQEEACAELRRCSRTQFDPELVEVFCGVLPP